MGNLDSNGPIGGKAERNRAIILAAALEQFSKLGYAATRIDDVADAVQLTRTGLFYYYRDKQTLYSAMLEDAFRPLVERLGVVLVEEHRSITERIELAAEAWVDAVVARPSLARLVLRFVADGTNQPGTAILSDNFENAAKFWALFTQGKNSGEIKPLLDDPFHAASALVGTTICYVSALSNLVPQGFSQPLNAAQVAGHKEQVLFSLRHVLGLKKTVNVTNENSSDRDRQE